MAGVKKENTIPLEIAIQKEVAYRRKVLSALHLRPDDDSLEKLLPKQVTPSIQTPRQAAFPVPPTPSPCLAGTKRKEPDNSYCEICRVSCSSVFNLEQHLMGHKHRSKLQELEYSHKRNGRDHEGRSRDGRKWCELCRVSCMNEDLLNLHLKGQKHRAEVIKFEMRKEGGGEMPNRRKWCEPCQIWCIDLFAFKQHLQGKKHTFQMHSMGEKKNKNGIREKNAMA